MMTVCHSLCGKLRVHEEQVRGEDWTEDRRVGEQLLPWASKGEDGSEGEHQAYEAGTRRDEGAWALASTYWRNEVDQSSVQYDTRSENNMAQRDDAAAEQDKGQIGHCTRVQQEQRRAHYSVRHGDGAVRFRIYELTADGAAKGKP
jgi:hypothetical protein